MALIYNILYHGGLIIWFKHFEPVLNAQKLLNQPKSEVIQLISK